jgi:tryptophan 2,3-dioxygenase
LKFPRFLQLLQEIDENWQQWRRRHAAMAHRMIGMKIGTGGTSGVEYLNRVATENIVFKDLW